jgi:hypothetical protein
MVKKEGNFIIITPFDDQDFEYDIPLIDVRSSDDIIRWMFHLLEKNWCTVSIINNALVIMNNYIKGWGR